VEILFTNGIYKLLQKSFDGLAVFQKKLH